MTSSREALEMGGLQDLPVDIQINIFSHLEPDDIPHLARVSP